MGSNSKDIHTIIRTIVAQETKFLRAYQGDVLSNQDSESLGRVQVEIPYLGLFGAVAAPWCWPRDKHGLSVPAVGETVMVAYLAGDPNYPYYWGTSQEITGQSPAAYTGNPLFHVLFQDPTGKTKITFDAEANVLTIGNSSPQPSARKGDATNSDDTTDATFWTWLAAAAVVLAGLGVSAPTPTSLTGKVSAGSSQVQVGDQ